MLALFSKVISYNGLRGVLVACDEESLVIYSKCGISVNIQQYRVYHIFNRSTGWEVHSGERNQGKTYFRLTKLTLHYWTGRSASRCRGVIQFLLIFQSAYTYFCRTPVDDYTLVKTILNFVKVDLLRYNSLLQSLGRLPKIPVEINNYFRYEIGFS